MDIPILKAGIIVFIMSCTAMTNAQFLPKQYLFPYDGGPWAFVDIDFDGYTDYVYVEDDNIFPYEEEKKVKWRRNNGIGKFSSSQLLLEQEAGISQFSATDLDGDEDIDLLIYDWAAKSYFTFENSGNNSFEPKGRLSEEAGEGSILGVADFNKDGFEDILYSKDSAPGMFVFLNDGDNTFSPGWETSNPTSRHKILDLNQDGQFDILAMYRLSVATSYISYWEGQGDGTFEGRENLITFTDNSYPFTFDFGDVDGDGDYDVVAGEYVYTTTLFINQGDEEFDEGTVLDVTTINRPQVVFADVDNDGDLDIYADSRNSTSTIPKDNTYWFENYGRGDYSKEIRLFTDDDEIGSISPFDVELDGDVDLIGINVNSGFFMRKSMYNSPYFDITVYEDENQNSVPDPSEHRINREFVDIVPKPVAVVHLSDTTFRYYVNQGNYRIRLDTSACYTLVNDSTEIRIQVDSTESYTLQLGVIPSSSRLEASSFLQSGPSRCGFDVKFHLNTKNTGCRSATGRVGIKQSDLAFFIEAEPMPTMLTEDTLWWDFEILDVEDRAHVELTYRIANDSFIGEFVQMPVFTYVKNDSGQLELIHESTYSSEIRCAFDPNDKAVQPQRDANNFTLPQEELFYTIRFQNTGNDTAFRVELRDAISPHLDPHSLNVIGSSHPFELKHDLINDQLTFVFDNILLPDSNTNLDGSQGYVSFIIDMLPDLSERTKIKNQAGIYFDFNKPIITNETLNTLVYAFLCRDSIGADGFRVLPIISDSLVTDISCHGFQDGRIEIHPRRGQGTYYINGIETDLHVDSLLATGSYTYYISDAGNCSDTLEVVIDEPDSIIVTTSVIEPSESTSQDGRIRVDNVVGGIPPYMFHWSTGFMGSVLNGIGNGMYSLVVSDQNGCLSDSMTFVLETSSTGNPNFAGVRIWPNPGQTDLTIDFGGHAVSHITVIDIHGKQLLNRTIEPGADRFVVPATELGTPGTYYLEIRNGDRSVLLPVVRL